MIGLYFGRHKAYMRGVLIKLHSIVKNQRFKQIDEVLSQITQLENQNKLATSQQLASDLLEQRQKVCSLLFFRFENNLKLTKAKYYALGN